MKILIKVGDVEVLYEKDESDDNRANAATCADDWSGNAKNKVLLGTISHMAREAKALYLDT